MSYPVTISGCFSYNSEEEVQQALDMLRDEIANPPQRDVNILVEENFVLEPFTISIHYTTFMPSSACYGCERVIKKMSAKAIAGEIVINFDGEKEVVFSGRGWS